MARWDSGSDFVTSGSATASSATITAASGTILTLTGNAGAVSDSALVSLQGARSIIGYNGSVTLIGGTKPIQIGPSSSASGQLVFELAPPAIGTVTAETTAFRHTAQTITITSGYSNQRFSYFQQPTISAASALTVTTAATLAIQGAPLASGAGPAAITNSYALWIQAGPIKMDATASQLIPGATSFSHRNNANSADNLIITDAGVATFRGGFKIDAAGHLISTVSGAPTTTNLGTNVTSATFTGNDVRGTIAVVMSGALAANTRAFTATFATSYGATSPFVMLVDQTSAVGLTIVNFYVSAVSTGVSFDLAADQALAAGTYTIDYIVIG